MKKIVFVQKDEGSAYDPVSTFFANKKAQSMSKPSATTQPKPFLHNNTQEPTKNKVTQPAGRLSSAVKKQSVKDSMIQEVKNIGSAKKQGEKQKVVTGKIGRKGEHLPPKKGMNGSETLKKEENIYGTGKRGIQNRIDNKKIGSQKNIKVNSKVEVIQEQSEFREEQHNQEINTQSKELLPAINSKSPYHQEHQGHQGFQVQQAPKSGQVGQLKKRIKQLQESEKYLLGRIEEHEQKQEKYIKNEQKLNKLQKQSKSSVLQAKDLQKKLSGKEEEIHKLLSKDQIPYNKKRQVLLINKINQLKKINKELTCRIKNYKGSDLVEISINHNKADILNEYDQGGQEAMKDYRKIESMVYRVINQISQYISKKMSSIKKNQGSDWNEDKKLLMQLMDTSKKLSLEMLGDEELDVKVPNSNEECSNINLYNQIENYRDCVEPIISKLELNFSISEQNIELINKIQENQGYIQEIKHSKLEAWHDLRHRKFKKVQEAIECYQMALKQIVGIYEQNLGWLQILVAQNMGYISLLNGHMKKQKSEQKQGVNILKCRIKQIEELVENENTKQSLHLYMKQNIKQLWDSISRIIEINKNLEIKSII